MGKKAICPKMVSFNMDGPNDDMEWMDVFKTIYGTLDENETLDVIIERMKERGAIKYVASPVAADSNA